MTGVRFIGLFLLLVAAIIAGAASEGNVQPADGLFALAVLIAVVAFLLVVFGGETHR